MKAKKRSTERRREPLQFASYIDLLWKEIDKSGRRHSWAACTLYLVDPWSFSLCNPFAGDDHSTCYGSKAERPSPPACCVKPAWPPARVLRLKCPHMLVLKTRTEPQCIHSFIHSFIHLFRQDCRKAKVDAYQSHAPD